MHTIIQAISKYLTKQGIKHNTTTTPHIHIPTPKNTTIIYLTKTQQIQITQLNPYYTATVQTIHPADPELLPRIIQALQQS